MDLALALAGYGALLSSIVAVPSVQRWTQDRPKFQLALSYDGTYEKSPGYEHLAGFPDDGFEGVHLVARLIVDLRNDGRVDSVVREVGIALSTTEDGGIGSHIPLSPPDGVVAVRGLGLERFFHENFEPIAVESADSPLRAYAIDARGRIHWSPPVPLYRQLLNNGWKPSHPFPSV
jgi:hypothetical protein